MVNLKKKRYNSMRSRIKEIIDREFNCDVHDKIKFVHHHTAHAVSALVHSGYESSLVLTIDGAGDRESAMILDGRDNRLKLIDKIFAQDSLGEIYQAVTMYLGFGQFEFKVMGLAPYGDPGSIPRSF